MRHGMEPPRKNFWSYERNFKFMLVMGWKWELNSMRYILMSFFNSLMVDRLTVNWLVVDSNPTQGVFFFFGMVITLKQCAFVFLKTPLSNKAIEFRFWGTFRNSLHDSASASFFCWLRSHLLEPAWFRQAYVNLDVSSTYFLSYGYSKDHFC